MALIIKMAECEIFATGDAFQIERVTCLDEEKNGCLLNLCAF
jgi:hypothetical protein